MRGHIKKSFRKFLAIFLVWFSMGCGGTISGNTYSADEAFQDWTTKISPVVTKKAQSSETQYIWVDFFVSNDFRSVLTQYKEEMAAANMPYTRAGFYASAGYLKLKGESDALRDKVFPRNQERIASGAAYVSIYYGNSPVLLVYLPNLQSLMEIAAYPEVKGIFAPADYHLDLPQADDETCPAPPEPCARPN